MSGKQTCGPTGAMRKRGKRKITSVLQVLAPRTENRGSLLALAAVLGASTPYDVTVLLEVVLRYKRSSILMGPFWGQDPILE